MTMMLSDEAQTIVSHFVQHMPHAVREVYEAKVCEMLKQNEGDTLDIQATCACVDVMWMLWDEARRETAKAKCTLHLNATGGGGFNS